MYYMGNTCATWSIDPYTTRNPMESLHFQVAQVLSKKKALRRAQDLMRFYSFLEISTVEIQTPKGGPYPRSDLSYHVKKGAKAP